MNPEPQQRSPQQQESVPWWRQDLAHDEQVADRELTTWRTRLGRLLVTLARRLARATSANAALVIIALVGLVVVAGLTLAGGAVYDAVSEGDGIAGFDRPVLEAAIADRGPVITPIVNAFTQLGGPIGMPIITVLILVIMVWRWRSKTPLVLMIIGVAGSLAITSIGKTIVGRVRPPLVDAVPPYEYAPSFPSGHALNSTVIAGIVAYLIFRRLKSRRARTVTIVVAALWPLAMGASRIFLGHHWLTDVVFAWLIGLAWVGLVITAHRLYLTVRRRRTAQVSTPHG